MKANIECDVQLFVTEHNTEIDQNTGNPLKGYYVTVDFAGTSASSHKFKDRNDLVTSFKDLDLLNNNWDTAQQGNFNQGAVSIPSNETIKHYVGFKAVLQNNNYGNSINRILVYLKTKNLTEAQLIIFEKGSNMAEFLDQITDFRQ